MRRLGQFGGETRVARKVLPRQPSIPLVARVLTLPEAFAYLASLDAEYSEQPQSHRPAQY